MHTPESDWDLALYYWATSTRTTCAPSAGRERTRRSASERRVFNGGDWLTIDDRHVDVHYRDLDVVEHEINEARLGRFHWEPLMSHLAGIPCYLVVAEIAVNRVLRGDALPSPQHPEALRTAAPLMWRERAAFTPVRAELLCSPRAGHRGRWVLATAAMQTTHAVLAERGDWVTNEKRLLE